MRILAAIHPPGATRAILVCLDLPSRAPPTSPARPEPPPSSWQPAQCRAGGHLPAGSPLPRHPAKGSVCPLVSAIPSQPRRLQQRIGGRIVYFCHDSDHDYRETTTPLRDLKTGDLKRLNFDHMGKLQKKYSPLCAKRIQADWQEKTARVLPCFVPPALVGTFLAVRAETVADFCLGMYRGLGLPSRGRPPSARPATDGLVVICGSLYLIGEIKKVLPR